MKFDPLILIKIANSNGLKLTRMGKNINIRSKGGIPSIWAVAIKKHKRRLLRHLPENEFISPQVDLFEDILKNE